MGPVQGLPGRHGAGEAPQERSPARKRRPRLRRREAAAGAQGRGTRGGGD